MNHIVKQYALSPTGKNPAEKMPLCDIKTSFVFSIDNDEPSLKVSDGAAEENGEDKTESRRRRRRRR